MTQGGRRLEALSFRHLQTLDVLMDYHGIDSIAQTALFPDFDDFGAELVGKQVRVEDAAGQVNAGSR